MNNSMYIKFPSLSINESFARTVVASFALNLSPTIEQLSDLKTVVSEAVTNCIVHAYRGTVGEIELVASQNDGEIIVTVSDTGIGIDDIDLAMEMSFTTRADEERSGMGFTIMQAFSDNLTVKKNYPCGTKVSFSKKLFFDKTINGEGGDNFVRAK